MRRRQTVPDRWLIVTGETGWRAARRLPRGAGVLLLAPLDANVMRQLRRLAQQRDLTVIVEGQHAARRVHNSRELGAAMLRRTPMILLSPLYPTASHPTWRPLERMRAAALARLGKRRLIALGGMDARRFARVRPLGFQAWAGISAFRT